MEIKVDDKTSLVLIDDSHADKVFNLINSCRPYLRQWLPWVDSSKSIDNTRDFIKFCRQCYENKFGIDLCIIVDNSIAGLISLHKIDHLNKSATIGYWLSDTFQGLGIMTNACSKLTYYCFATLELNRIEIKCATDNLKSQAIPERLKFKKEGTLRQAEFLNNKFVDQYLYATVRKDWNCVGHQQLYPTIPF